MMHCFIPDKTNLRGGLLLLFHLKKSAAESQRLLVEAYGSEYALSKSQCRKWFQRFKSNDFELNDKERPGKPKKFKDAELKALIDEDPYQSEAKLAEELNVVRSTVGKRLHKIGFIQKEGKWVSHVLTDVQTIN